MNAKDKANELMVKFVGISLSQVNELVDGIRIRLAKESALILVEEILTYSKLHGFIALTDYWNEVKIEIEKVF